MKEKRFTVTLADGTKLENLKLNGNNFISSVKIEESLFKDNCTPVTISDGETSEVHDNMELVQVIPYNGEYWFILRDLPAEELRRIKMESDIEYLAMMTGVEL